MSCVCGSKVDTSFQGIENHGISTLRLQAELLKSTFGLSTRRKKWKQVSYNYQESSIIVHLLFRSLAVGWSALQISGRHASSLVQITWWRPLLLLPVLMPTHCLIRSRCHRCVPWLCFRHVALVSQSLQQPKLHQHSMYNKIQQLYMTWLDWLDSTDSTWLDHTPTKKQQGRGQLWLRWLRRRQ